MAHHASVAWIPPAGSSNEENNDGKRGDEHSGNEQYTYSNKRHRSSQMDEPKLKSWDQRFHELKQYKEAFGDCLVPQKYPPNPKLGRWVENQRSAYHRMMKAKETGVVDIFCSGMTEARIAQLEEIGFVWAVKRGKGKRQHKDVGPPITWNDRLKELNDFTQQGGDVNSLQADASPLGKWLDTQRTLHETSTLPLERIALLEAVGVVFSYNKNLAEKPDVAKQAPRSTVPECNYHDPEEEWNQRFEELKDYCEEHGNCLVPTKYMKNPKLGRFVSTQRSQYHSYVKAKEAGNSDLATRHMNEERIAALEAIGFVWTVKGKGLEDQNANIRWNTRYEELKAYKEQHGDCLIPSKYPNNPQLARWVGNQRQMYSRYQAAKAEGRVDPLAGGMNEDRIAKLEQIGFAWSTKSPGGKSWDTRFTELYAYREQHGNCHIPRNYPPNQSLSNWCASLRNHYKIFMKNQESLPLSEEYTMLTAERIAALENIGFVWAPRKRGSTPDDEMEDAEVGNVHMAQPSLPEVNRASYAEFDVNDVMGVEI
jgi:hypothetical protein